MESRKGKRGGGFFVSVCFRGRQASEAAATEGSTRATYSLRLREERAHARLPVRVPIAVVVAQEVLLPELGILGDLKRLVHVRKKVFGDVFRHQLQQALGRTRAGEANGDARGVSKSGREEGFERHQAEKARSTQVSTYLDAVGGHSVRLTSRYV